MDAHRCYNSATWRKVRLVILERDGYICQIGLDGCTERATDVDHIIPIEADGEWFDENNLRAACKHCNSARVFRASHRRRPSRDL
ncbi:MAG: HNH endonuclease [Acidimicrobiia bacterium]|nr:HNH endonuclease [Acidimicrobiia bacterium]